MMGSVVFAGLVAIGVLAAGQGQQAGLQILLAAVGWLSARFGLSRLLYRGRDPGKAGAFTLNLIATLVAILALGYPGLVFGLAAVIVIAALI